MPRKRRQPKTPASDAPTRTGAAVAERSDATESSLTSAQWTTLRKRILSDQRTRPLKSIYGDTVNRGAVFRWGMATATNSACNVEFQWLTRLASGVPTDRKRFRGIQPQDMMLRFQDVLAGNACELSDASTALVWAAAMPELLQHLDENQWWDLLGSIQDYRDSLLHRDPTEPEVLVGVAEIGLTLAWCLRALPSCHRLASSSQEALQKWCEQDDLSLSAVLANSPNARLALASVLRLRMLLDVVTVEKRSSDRSKQEQQTRKKKNRDAKRIPIALKALNEIGIELTTWVAAMTRGGGQQSFTTLTKSELRDDLGPNGLLISAAELDSPALVPAMKAALGESKTKGRLAWQISLPEAMLHDEDAKLACLLPEWDVRRGRSVIQYDGRDTRLELTAGKRSVISGKCESQVVIDGERKFPCGDWVATCEYSDDDIHYLELEQPHDGGYVLQRQVMVVREDCCFYFADAVVQGQIQTDIQDSQNPESPLPRIEYQLRLPLADSIQAKLEDRTTEIFLCDTRRRALVLPLSESEWKNTNSATQLRVTADQHLLLTSKGHGQIHVPLWFDLSRDRFPMNRTWRQLTVAQQLRQVPSRTAAAYRVQVGKTQWIIYRSMAQSVPRTFFGKHMIADFYCARFDAKEQSLEALITVEDTPN